MKPIVFYDGTCALCHGFVRWVARNDPAGVFQFAPLQGETFRRLVMPGQALPDSVVIRAGSGDLYAESEAVAFLLREIGWTRSAGLLQLIPLALRDFGYRIVARVRYPIFGRRQEWCPILPERLGDRFLR